MSADRGGDVRFLILGMVLIVVAIVAIVLLGGCAAQMPIRIAPEIQAVLAAQANIDRSIKNLTARVEGTGNVVDQSTRTVDEWTTRLAEVRQIVADLNRWWPWIVLGLVFGVPLSTYVVPKLGWVLVSRLMNGGRVP